MLLMEMFTSMKGSLMQKKVRRPIGSKKRYAAGNLAAAA